MMGRVFIQRLLVIMLSLMSMTWGTENLFYRLQPNSLLQAAAYWILFHDTETGEMARERLDGLIFHSTGKRVVFEEDEELFSEHHCEQIIALCDGFPNRTLLGYHAQTIEEIQNLPPEEVDLSKILILYEFPHDSIEAKKYLAQLDLYALHVLAALPERPSAHQKIMAMNRWIFDDLHIRFPPQSVFSKYIDQYTLLSKVMDNHLGVCLGVTTLYMCIAQRIGLPLQGVTPPGHIFLRYEEEGINIETTARGIHKNDAAYEGVLGIKNPCCNVKEMVGWVFVNQASICLQNHEYAMAVQYYLRALEYLPDYPLVLQLLGLSLEFDHQEGKQYLLQAREQFYKKGDRCTLLEDYLEGSCDQQAIEAYFMRTTTERSSIEHKQQLLLESLNRYPYFRDGLEQVAVGYVQLGRKAEAITYFERYIEREENPLVLYYLVSLYLERKDFVQSWFYFDKLMQNVDITHSKLLQQLYAQLIMNFPKP